MVTSTDIDEIMRITAQVLFGNDQWPDIYNLTAIRKRVADIMTAINYRRHVINDYDEQNGRHMLANGRHQEFYDELERLEQELDQIGINDPAEELIHLLLPLNGRTQQTLSDELNGALIGAGLI